MTHIIGKPKPSKRGATFGDVPVGEACIRKGNVATVRLVRMDEHEGAEGQRWNAVALGGTTLMWVDYHAPVTPLRIEPVEPEPDPGVPYGEQQPEDWFVFSSAPDVLCQCTLAGHTSQGAHHDAARFGHLRVTPVPASVVVHEEPGTWVHDAESSGRTPMATIGDDCDETIVVSAEDAEHIVAELSAWLCSLAQRDEGFEEGADRAYDQGLKDGAASASTELARLRAEVERLRSALDCVARQLNPHDRRHLRRGELYPVSFAVTEEDFRCIADALARGDGAS